jgi:putative redox protein
MRPVLARSGSVPHLQHVTVATHALVSDEPAEFGGADAGPSPTELLLAALAACETMTARMYALRKGWDLREIRITLHGHDEQGTFVIDRHVDMDGDLTDDQRARIVEIAGRCPVARRLTGPVVIR